jgi:ParB family chromosome partitioning protein
VKIELESIKASPFQVRSDETVEEEIIELAQSIHQHGLLQPIKVRPIEEGYELIYGHRRVAAMRYLGWQSCEAIVEGIDDQNSHVQGLIENLQRKDISSVELGEGLKKLQERTGWTQREIAEKLGISSSSVAVALKLVDELSESLKPLVQSAGAGGRFVENGLSNYQALEITRTAKEPELQEALARKVMQEKIPHPQIREIRKALQAVPEDDKEAMLRIIETPWTRTAEEVSRQVLFASQHEFLPQTTAGSTNEHWHDKCLWNVKRLGSIGIQFFTINYAERIRIHVARSRHIIPLN